MEAVLLIDFGSTNTKVTAVDIAGERLLGTAAAFTTVESDIGEGLAQALTELEKQAGPLRVLKRRACSSAAGGLRMVAGGLVPSLTAEAARLASLGAGAKVVKVFSYELTDEDAAEIASLKPDIFLLCGGVDGGNKEVIIHNARMLAALQADFPVLLAGNRTAAAECEKILSGRELIRCPNVLPQLGKLNIEPVQAQIRELFLRRIIRAKGLSREQELVSGILMPTPAAVKRAVELLASGLPAGQCPRPGIGELVAVDLGGATTDVYSVARGMPQAGEVILKGLPEPFSKRTVEGDIGMRYSAAGVLEAAGAARLAELSGLEEEQVAAGIARLSAHPDALPGGAEEENLDFALAAAAVETAVTRHAGTLEEIYTPAGPALVQTGKDLTAVDNLVLTGGALIRNPRIREIAACARSTRKAPASLRPKGGRLFIDRSYILAAMGLLAEEYPQAALSIMYKEIQKYGD
ncbi:MAG: glutamate mutase L [Spirochaetaceae bacterium]|jgi:uncharacterized protein (TIGR01319 family)|nr:glutamate mutase L [Spirochaetaceae bacterium]